MYDIALQEIKFQEFFKGKSDICEETAPLYPLNICPAQV